MKSTQLTKSLLVISIIVGSPAAFSQTAVAKPKMEEKVGVQVGSLAMMIKDSTTFSILTKALKATELDLVLGNKGEFTIFAPTDEAFGKLPSGMLVKLMLPENKEKLRSLLLYHVIAGKVLAGDLKDGEVKMMNGEKVRIDADPNKVEINGAKIFSADVLANNGVMHSIGMVIIPKSLDKLSDLNK
jgi:uncharacterized surface protein with fasciclin (FAS1) repeats